VATVSTQQEEAIFDLSFAVETRYRPFDVVGPGFEAVREPAVGPMTELAVADGSPRAPYAAVELEVADAGDAVVLAGLATAGGDHVLAVYDPRRGRAGIEVRRAGRTRLVRRRKVALPDAFRFAFVLCENRVTVLADTGDGWLPLLSARDRVAAAVDLRVAETLAEFRFAWGARTDGGPAELGAVRAGLFGMTGIRDPHLVQHSDGRPYQRDGLAYLTATCAGTGFFPQAHWGVFTLDLARPSRLRQVAKLFSKRDGMVLGDHAGQVVRDDAHDRWIVATSSWGDFSGEGVHVRHTSTTADLLHGVHVLDTEPTPLPTSDSSWDPGVTRIDGRWYVGFVQSPSQKPFQHHPALAVSGNGGDWTDDLRLVGAATEMDKCEGPVIARVDGAWWLLASDGRRREYPVFSLGMQRRGSLDAPYPSNIPHPQLVGLEDGGYLMVTFDGTPYGERLLGYGGHGDVVIMRSRPGSPGGAGHA
jgi:hypothetical protein